MASLPTANTPTPHDFTHQKYLQRLPFTLTQTYGTLSPCNTISLPANAFKRTSTAKIVFVYFRQLGVSFCLPASRPSPRFIILVLRFSVFPPHLGITGIVSKSSSTTNSVPDVDIYAKFTTNTLLLALCTGRHWNNRRVRCAAVVSCC